MMENVEVGLYVGIMVVVVLLIARKFVPSFTV